MKLVYKKNPIYTKVIKLIDLAILGKLEEKTNNKGKEITIEDDDDEDIEIDLVPTSPEK